MNEKANSTLETRGEESFEFAPVRDLGDRYVSNVQNHSHDDDEAHIYPVYFEVEATETGVRVSVVGCGCPAAEYYDEICKHCQTASESAELLSRVIEAALTDNVDEDEQDAHATEESDSGQLVATDGGQPTEDCACEKLPDDMSCFEHFEGDNDAEDADDGDQPEVRTDGGQPAAEDPEQVTEAAVLACEIMEVEGFSYEAATAATWEYQFESAPDWGFLSVGPEAVETATYDDWGELPVEPYHWYVFYEDRLISTFSPAGGTAYGPDGTEERMIQAFRDELDHLTADQQEVSE